MDCPPLFSQRRAAFLSGLSRGALSRLIADGNLPVNESGQVSRQDLESFLGFRISAQRWDDATIAIQRAGMANA